RPGRGSDRELCDAQRRVDRTGRAVANDKPCLRAGPLLILFFCLRRRHSCLSINLGAEYWGRCAKIRKSFAVLYTTEYDFNSIWVLYFDNSDPERNTPPTFQLFPRDSGNVGALCPA